jgi:predicted transcriptional regulator
MMVRRNLTLQLDDELVQRAKVLAARRGTSVSGLVAQVVTELVEREARYDHARERALKALMKTSPRGGRRWTRDEIYDRQKARGA